MDRFRGKVCGQGAEAYADAGKSKKKNKQTLFFFGFSSVFVSSSA